MKNRIDRFLTHQNPPNVAQQRVSAVHNPPKNPPNGQISQNFTDLCRSDAENPPQSTRTHRIIHQKKFVVFQRTNLFLTRFGGLVGYDLEHENIFQKKAEFPPRSKILSGIHPARKMRGSAFCPLVDLVNPSRRTSGYCP